MVNNQYAGEFNIVLENINGTTVVSDKRFGGLIKISPTMHLDSEKISAYYILGLGGGYVEGEKYKYSVLVKNNARAIITTQAATKVYKCLNEKAAIQEIQLKIEGNGILEYITDNVILYKDALYKQDNEIYLDKDSTLIYSDGITSGWSVTGEAFSYSRLQLRTKVYMDNVLVLLDNLLINPIEDDVTKLGYFEGYENFGTLLVINKKITNEIIDTLRLSLKNLNLDINFCLSEIEVNGFVLRVLGHSTQNVDEAIKLCHNYVRKVLFNSKELSIRKY